MSAQEAEADELRALRQAPIKGASDGSEGKRPARAVASLLWSQPLQALSCQTPHALLLQAAAVAAGSCTRYSWRSCSPSCWP
jgi:hypothetical protein